MLRKSVLLSAVLLAIPLRSVAQDGPGTVHFQAKLGSFKILKHNLDVPAEGRLEISFSGTLMISGYQGKPYKPTMKGNLKQEFPDPRVIANYNDSNFTKVVLHGTGSLVLDGKYFAVQWFGRDLKAKWVGKGFLRLYGEFDEDGNTGTYYFLDPKKVNYWASPSMQLIMPGSMFGQPGGIGKAVERGKGGTTPPPSTNKPPKKGKG